MSGSDERDDRCPECGQRRHRFHAPSLPSTRLPRWVFLGLGVMLGAFGALAASSIGAEPQSDDQAPTTVVRADDDSRPAEANPSTVVTSTTPSTTTSTTSTTTTSTTTTLPTTVAPTDPPTTPPGANVAVTVTTTTTTTTVAPTTAAATVTSAP